LKKTYGKPDIVFDDFKMCANIAWCAQAVGFYRGTCGIKMTGGITVFASEASNVDEGACNYDVDLSDGINVENEAWNGLCYHVPTADGSMFYS
jgi:hypothetical protein